MKNYFFPFSLKKVLSLVLLLLIGGSLWGLFNLKPQENILGLVPASLREKVALFELSPLNRKLFAVVVAQDETESLQYAQKLQAKLLEKQLIKPGFTPSPQFVRTLLTALPFRFTDQDRNALEKKITPEAVSRSMQENYEKLVSLEGFLLKPLILADPLHWVDLMTQKLALLNPDTNARYEDGFLTAQDGRVRVGIYEISGPGNFSDAKQMSQAFESFASQIPASVQAFFLGGLRYTAENVSAIKRDLWKVGLLALVGLAFIFWLFLRDKQALLIYVLPLAVTPIAALITYAVFGQISGITLGFGSVVAGLSVDYAVYVFFALRNRQNRLPLSIHFKKHLLLTFLTSCVCFGTLLFSSIEVFRQIAVFAISGLLISLAAALFIFPLYWKQLTPLIIASRPTKRVFSKKIAVWMSLGIFLLGIAGLKYTHFSGDLNSLNASSKAFAKERSLLQQALDGAEKNQALLFMTGTSREDALEKNELFAREFSIPLATSELFPSARGAKKHLAAWNSFWTSQRKLAVQQTVQSSAQKVGISPQAFAPFFEFLDRAPREDTFDISLLYNPVLEVNGKWAVVNILPSSPQLIAAAQRFGAVLISGPVLQQELLQAIKKEALRLVTWAFGLNLLLVCVWTGSLKKTVFVFIPVVLAAGVTFACFWLFRVEVNLFVLIFLPLLIGLGIDYGIFQLARSQSNADENTVYAPQALWTAALSTLVGFGVLVFARHGVLFIMGLSSFLGVGGALLVAQFILPPLLEEK